MALKLLFIGLCRLAAGNEPLLNTFFSFCMLPLFSADL